MSIAYPYLKDSQFLKMTDELKLTTQYIKFTLLN